jgi:hypothetical protein
VTTLGPFPCGWCSLERKPSIGFEIPHDDVPAAAGLRVPAVAALRADCAAVVGAWPPATVAATSGTPDPDNSAGSSTEREKPDRTPSASRSAMDVPLSCANTMVGEYAGGVPREVLLPRGRPRGCHEPLGHLFRPLTERSPSTHQSTLPFSVGHHHQRPAMPNRRPRRKPRRRPS